MGQKESLRHCMGVCLAMALGAAVCHGQEKSLPIRPMSAVEQAIRQALDETSSVEFIDTPLTDVVAYLADNHDIQLHLDRRALDDAGIGSDTPVSIELKDISLRSVLNLMFKELDITYLIQNEVLLITTRDEANQTLETVVYDVRDLVETSAGESRADLHQLLIEAIKFEIAPVTWDQVGGPGSLGSFDGMLVITQKQAVHQQIADLLETLRKVRTHRTAGQPVEAATDPQRISLRVYPVQVPMATLTTLDDASSVEGQKKIPVGSFCGSVRPTRPSMRRPPAGERLVGNPNTEYLDTLVATIASTIEPASWQQAGGAGVIQPLPAGTDGVGTLVIKQTADVHAQIERLLKQIDNSRDQAMSGGGFF